MPASTKQSTLRFPVSAIFSSEANVRLLRELFRHGGELSAPEIGKRAGVSRQHALRTLYSLGELGIVEAVGVSGHPSYRVCVTYPLHEVISALFLAEEERFSAIREAIRTAAGTDPSPEAIWLYGSVARKEDTPRSDIDVAIVFPDDLVEHAAGEMRERLSPAEESLGFSASIVGIGPHDVLRLSAGDPWWTTLARDAITLAGPDPERLAARIRRRNKVKQQSPEA
jgi:predicted nucleotidyltransferase